MFSGCRIDIRDRIGSAAKYTRCPGNLGRFYLRKLHRHRPNFCCLGEIPQQVFNQISNLSIIFFNEHCSEGEDIKPGVSLRCFAING